LKDVVRYTCTVLISVVQLHPLSGLFTGASSRSIIFTIMGMDIIARTRERNYPSLHYNLAGWSALISFLRSWKVDVREFSGFNDGERI